ncbi:phage tail-collar fiber family protein [Clostridium argentinense CDC 2741]|uniref:Phage tail-collar fiber family protein n=1 Tax=Clostridium argentinense CDC 2741 TaxID=1418104 RepID=A0A0C1RAC0_9CLOT|nr:phage tail protein [Clostridium argentinense]ARC84545.1 hypothetical protein RSJ17_08380 [Clostridium argentinense]KIE47386.1 phage tail-collar fiber family protein [Clostridium argentinense CDC 2741]NFF38673.1 phage tail protein [Clostridium argentinense]NFP48898.1 phage tail protein [Clostridium argentinense]NFP72954.1 phage tail protein [Clostridium argentinense]
MAEQFYSILTSIGKAKIANANALGNKLNLTTLVLGDGNGKYYNPTENQEAIVNEVWKGNISSITTDSKNPNWIVIETIIAGNVGGFFIREVGIFDDEGSLIAIGKYPETYKPVISDGSTKDLIIRMILEVSNSANVTLKIDPAIIMATKKDVEVLESKIRDLKGVYAEDLLDETVIIEGEMHPLIKSEFEKVETKINDNKENLQEVTSQMAEMTKEIENIDLSANKVKLNKVSGMNATEVQTAIQELFQFADNGKKNISTVIGSPLTTSDTFDSMKSKIQTLKNTFATNLTSKEQSSSGSESLESLINKVKNINPQKKWVKGDFKGSESGSSRSVYLKWKPGVIIVNSEDPYNSNYTSCTIVAWRPDSESYARSYSSMGANLLADISIVSDTEFKVNSLRNEFAYRWLAIEL